MSLAPEIKITEQRLSVLELAKALGNILAACKQRGMSQRQFYEYKRRFQTHGIEGLRNLLDSIPEIDHTAAYAILAEIGSIISAFTTAQYIYVWAGLAPGNQESAGKRKKQGVTPGNNYLKTIL